MSGHSKWSTIKRKKEKTDGARAKVFTKIGRELAVAVREGGGADPSSNSTLRECIAKAKANNVSHVIIAAFVSDIMMGIFENYMVCAKEAPDLLEYNFNIIKNFYNKLFKTYEKVNQTLLQQLLHSRLKRLMALRSDVFPSVNLNQFLDSLK